MSWWHDAAFKLTFDPAADTGGEGTILVGLGKHGGADNHALLLNPKDSGIAARSVSEYVAKLAATEAGRWRGAFPGGMASVREIVVEDLSLDTCYALLLFAAVVERGDTARLCSAAWLDYVSAWELGYAIDPVPERSVACLHTTLAHTYLAYDAADADDTVTLNPNVLREGLRDCLTFLDAIVTASPDPTAPTLPEKTAIHSRAQSHLRFERQTYKRALQHGCVCQLLVPLGSGRKVLVDALILSEDQPSALLKVFARKDRDSFTGNGYAVLAMHRPQAAGTGNDMVVSVDPDSGLTLKALWHKLEELENGRWGDARPCNDPRNIVSNRGEDGKPRPGSPNQPWWDDGGKYTLVAAPKKDGGQSGTRLSWDGDVVPALWELYCPFEAVKYEVALHKSADSRWAKVVWRKAYSMSAAVSPTLYACLAQLSRGDKISHPRELLPAGQFETLRVPGGMVVVHAGGATIFDDWSDRRVSAGLDRLVQEIGEARSQFGEVEGDAILKKAIKQLKEKRVRLAELRALRESLLEARQKLQSATAMAVGGAEGDDVALVRRTLRRWWGIDTNREELGQTLDRLDAVISQLHEERVERSGRIARRLFSAFAPAVAVKELIEGVRYLWTPNPHEWAFQLLKGHDSAEHLHHVVETIVQREHIEIGVVVAAFMLGLAYAVGGITIKSEE
jgi:hypothetical protein